MTIEESLASVDDALAISAAIEAVLLVATEPVEPAVLAQLVEIPTTRVVGICEQLATDYARDRRGFTIARVAGGFRFQTVAEQAPYVERFVLEGQVARLSGPALETLAIVAYKRQHWRYKSLSRWGQPQLAHSECFRLGGWLAWDRARYGD